MGSLIHVDNLSGCCFQHNICITLQNATALTATLAMLRVKVLQIQTNTTEKRKWKGIEQNIFFNSY